MPQIFRHTVKHVEVNGGSSLKNVQYPCGSLFNIHFVVTIAPIIKPSWPKLCHHQRSIRLEDKQPHYYQLTTLYLYHKYTAHAIYPQGYWNYHRAISSDRPIGSRMRTTTSTRYHVYPPKLGTLRSDNAMATRTSKVQQQFCTCIVLFCTFLCRFCMTSTRNCLILHFTEDVTTKFSFSFWTWIGILRIHLHGKLSIFDNSIVDG